VINTIDFNKSASSPVFVEGTNLDNGTPVFDCQQQVRW